MLSQQDLKVNATALHVHRDTYMLVLNFNFPKIFVQPRDEFNRLLDITANYLERQFYRDFRYKILASYYLKHKQTGDVILFTGGFFLDRARLHRSTALSGEHWLPYEYRDLFKDDMLRCCDETYASRVLTWTDKDSSYTFDEISTYILSVQTTTTALNPFIQEHGLLRYGARRNRRTITFTIF